MLIIITITSNSVEKIASDDHPPGNRSENKTVITQLKTLVSVGVIISCVELLIFTVI